MPPRCCGVTDACLRTGHCSTTAPVDCCADGQALVRDFVEHPVIGADDFITKLRGQLDRSSVSTVQLAAELLFIHLLIARSDTVSGRRKREIVQSVLGFTDGTASLPVDLAVALDSGLVRPGAGVQLL